MKLRSMGWNEKTWNALIRSFAYIPPTIRMEALLTMIKTSEEEARGRKSPKVEEEDLVKAAKKKVPTPYKSISLLILKECGINNWIDRNQSSKPTKQSK